MTSKMPEFDVPPEMREMLEKGVSQARQGFETVMAAADEAAKSIDAKADKAQGQASDLRRRTMEFTGQNVSAAFELATKLVKAKSLDEVMRLQSDYMTSQFATLRGQIHDAGQTLQAQAQAAAADMASATKDLQAKAKDALDQTVAMTRDAAAKAGKPGRKPTK